MDPIKVLLVIEVPLIGSIFASVLEDEPDIKVVGCATTLQDALQFIQKQEAECCPGKRRAAGSGRTGAYAYNCGSDVIYESGGAGIIGRK